MARRVRRSPNQKSAKYDNRKRALSPDVRPGSTNDTTTFREAICASSNDSANHRQPGYLLIGVKDKAGKASGLKADDALLRNLAV